MGRTQPRLFTLPLIGPRIPPAPLRVPPPAHALALRTIPRDRLREQTPAALLRLAPGRAQAAHGLPHLPPQGAHAEVAVRGPHVGLDPPRAREHVRDRVQRELGDEQAPAAEGRGRYWRGRRAGEDRERAEDNAGEEERMEPGGRVACE